MLRAVLGQDSIHMVINVSSASEYFALCGNLWTGQRPKWKRSQLSRGAFWLKQKREVTLMFGAHWLVTSFRSTQQCVHQSVKIIGRMSLSAIGQVASDDTIGMTEATSFLYDPKWRNAGVPSRKRQADATDLVAKHVRLDRVAASNLV